MEKILDRVRKLLELANSSNANEAANALGQAQKLMARHGIGEAMLAADEPEPTGEIEDCLLHTDGAGSWRGSLALYVARANQCRVYRTGGELRIVGYPRARDAARYLYTYAASEIDRLCRAAMAARGNPGRTWANNFRVGAVSAIGDSLREAAAQARAEMRREASDGDTLGTGAALVRVNEAIAKIDAHEVDVNRWVRANLNLRQGGASRHRYDPSARAEGYRAGKTVDLGRGRAGQLGSGGKALRG